MCATIGKRIIGSFSVSEANPLFPSRERLDLRLMRIVAKRTLREFWVAHSDAEQPLKAWHREAARADWSNTAEVKAHYRSASFVGEPVVFNIAGNKYRLVVWINYPHRVVYVRFVGTHKDDDKVEIGKV